MKQLKLSIVLANIAAAGANALVAVYHAGHGDPLVCWLFVVLALNNASIAWIGWTRERPAEGGPK